MNDVLLLRQCIFIFLCVVIKFYIFGKKMFLKLCNNSLICKKKLFFQFLPLPNKKSNTMVSANDLKKLKDGEWTIVSTYAQLKNVNDEVPIEPFSEKGTPEHLEINVFNHDLVKNGTCRIVIYKEHENIFTIKVLVKNLTDDDYGQPRKYSITNWRTILSRTNLAIAGFTFKQNIEKRKKGKRSREDKVQRSKPADDDDNNEDDENDEVENEEVENEEVEYDDNQKKKKTNLEQHLDRIVSDLKKEVHSLSCDLVFCKKEIRKLTTAQNKLASKAGLRENKAEPIINNGGKKDACIHCSASVDKGYFINLELLGHKDKTQDIRALKAHDAFKILCKEHTCKRCIYSNKGLWVDKNNKTTMCMICRVKRVSGRGRLCMKCSLIEQPMVGQHAVNKQIFIDCMLVIQSTVNKIINYGCLSEFQPQGDQFGPIDSVLEIDINDKKIIYMIEFNRTHPETYSTFTHKFLQLRKAKNPGQIFAFCVNICDTSTMSLAEKLDCLRRWIILTIEHSNVFPSKNHWWFFWDENKSPFRNEEYISPFLSTAVKIMYPPWPKDGISCWKYASDPMAGHILRQAKHKKDKDNRSPLSPSQGGPSTSMDNSTKPGQYIQKEQRIEAFNYYYETAISIESVLGANWESTYSAGRNPDSYPEIDELSCSKNCKDCNQFLG
jgi:hypothetical protein